MSVTTPALPPIWTRIDDHLDRYDVIFSDIWGVLHNGKTAWPLASEALTRYRARGGKVVLVSNAPRPGVLVPELLAHWGVLPTAWDEIVTSGDVTRQLIVERGNTPFLHIGPERDLPLLGEQAALRVPMEEAGYIVCSGLYDDETETPDDYVAMLEQAKARGLDMICANPDLVVERGPQLIYCAGALAERYREMGGQAFYAGKPHAPIYRAAHLLGQKLLDRDLPKQRILAIGDAFYTDVAGAVAQGIDCLFVARGIHSEDFGLHHGTLSQEGVAKGMVDRQHLPVAIMDVLA